MSELGKELRHELEKDNARLLKRLWSHAKWERRKTIANLMDQNLRLRLMVSIMEGRSVLICQRRSKIASAGRSKDASRKDAGAEAQVGAS